MQKLIKLSEEHYVVVDDSEIEVGDFVLQENHEKTNTHIIKVEKEFQAEIGNDKQGTFTKRKITHSFGKELEGVENRPLSEAQEIEYGYSVEKMAYDYASSELKRPITVYPILEANVSEYKSYTKGFKAHKELTKDNLFSIEDIRKAFRAGEAYSLGSHKDFKQTHLNEKEYIKSLLPPTEWEI